MAMLVGQTAERSMFVTKEIVERYAELTGDYNPLHFDDEFASKTRFGRLISQGGIAVGLIHALVAMDLPDGETRDRVWQGCWDRGLAVLRCRG